MSQQASVVEQFKEHKTCTAVCLKPRLHQGNMLPGNKFLVRATCCLYLGNVIIIHLCHAVDLYIPFVSSNRRATNWQQFCC